MQVKRIIIDRDANILRIVVVIFFFFFFNDTVTTEIYTEWIVGSVRCV